MRTRISKFRGTACPLGLSPEFPLNPEIPLDGSPSPIELEAADGKRYKLGKRFLLLTGRMEAGEGQKGHRPLIRILPELLNKFPDVQLVFPGPGDDHGNLEEFA